jgi:hypothetical protein
MHILSVVGMIAVCDQVPLGSVIYVDYGVKGSRLLWTALGGSVSVHGKSLPEPTSRQKYLLLTRRMGEVDENRVFGRKSCGKEVSGEALGVVEREEAHPRPAWGDFAGSASWETYLNEA